MLKISSIKNIDEWLNNPEDIINKDNGKAYINNITVEHAGLGLKECSMEECSKN